MNKWGQLKFYLLIIFISANLSADEIFYLQRSPRGLLMGDAYQQLAEDDFTLYYNPALLGRHKGVSLNLLNIEVEATNPIDQTDRFDNFPSDTQVVDITERLMGFPMYLKLGTVPGLKLSSFGFSLFSTAQTSLSVENAITPFLDIDYTYDRGFATGLAFTLGKVNKRNMKKKDYENSGFGRGFSTSFGFGTKYIKREGLSRSFRMFGTTLLNEIVSNNNKDFYSIRESLGFSKGQGWSYDFGIDQRYSTRVSQVSWGLSYQNILDLHFEETEGNRSVPDLRQKVGLGFAFQQDFGLAGYSLAIDLRPIDYDIPFSRKLHVGAKLDLPIIDFYVGINESYLSYGAEIDLWLFSLIAGFYSVELATETKEYEGQRALVYLSLVNFSFDGQ